MRLDTNRSTAVARALRRAAAAALALVAAGCTTRAEAPPSEILIEPIGAPNAAASAAASTAPPGAAVEIDEGKALREGRVAFVGMVRAVKGGHEVRGAIFADEALPSALAKNAVDGLPADPAWFVGAKVRVTATLKREEAPPAQTDGLAEQRREGTWLTAASVESVSLVARAELVEGKLGRSKGLFQIGGHLVSRRELGQVIPGGAGDGDRVRLWGQPRTHHCGPEEQCLVGGSIPLFDIGRGEKLPD